MSLDDQKSLFAVSGRPKINMFYTGQPIINIFCPKEHQKSIFSVPSTPKMNNLCPRSTKNQYFLSPKHQKKSQNHRASKITILRSWSTKNEYFVSMEHQKSIFPSPRPAPGNWRIDPRSSQTLPQNSRDHQKLPRMARRRQTSESLDTGHPAAAADPAYPQASSPSRAGAPNATPGDISATEGSGHPL